MDVDRVLKELQGLGALGRPKKSETSLEESGPPSGTWERDPRIDSTLEALDRVRDLWNNLLEAQEAFEKALGELLSVWEVEEGSDAPEGVGGSQVDSESVPAAPPPVLKIVREKASMDQGSDALQRAREAARRKILGEDLSDEDKRRLVAENEDDDTPFVGQVRARVETRSTGESTVGSLGTIKASFPKEKDDA